MALKSEVLRALQAAGATLEMILCAIEAAEREDLAKVERRREHTAARVRRHRAAKRNAGNACNALPPLPPPDGPPLPPGPPSPPLYPPETPGSDPDGSAPEAGAGRVDFRKDLFERGTRTVQELTGRSTDKVRALVGSWRGLAGGDCAAVLTAIDAAVADAVIEPVAWIEARLKRRRAEASAGRAGFRPNGTFSARDTLPAVAGSHGFPASGAGPQAWNDRAMAMALRGEWPVGGRVFVAADSPEGDAWEAHYRRLGKGAKWRVLAKGMGSMMPSAMPPLQMAEMV